MQFSTRRKVFHGENIITVNYECPDRDAGQPGSNFPSWKAF